VMANGTTVASLVIAAIFTAAPWQRITNWTSSPGCWVLEDRTSTEPLSPEQTERIRAGRLREAAEVAATSGSVLAISRPLPEGTVGDLPQLLRLSSHVLVGTVANCATYVQSADRPVVRSIFEISVVENLKGPASPGTKVWLDMEGGRVAFGPNVVAEVRVSRMNLPHRPGQRYVLFLQPRLDQAYDGAPVFATSPTLQPVRGPFGMFEVTSAGVLRTSRVPALGVSALFDRRPAADLLTEVRRLLQTSD
jgi:hypothetical protein